jgi:hypothetical protein
MPLEQKIIDIPLAQSVDTHVDPKLTKGNLQLVNGLISYEGTVTKAPGREVLPKTTQLSTGGAGQAIIGGMAVLPSRDPRDIKIAVDTGPLYYPNSYHAWDAGRAVWTPIGCCTPCKIEIQAGPRIVGA